MDDAVKNRALHTHHMHKNHSQITPSRAHFLYLSTHKVCINPPYSWYEWLRSNLILCLKCYVHHLTLTTLMLHPPPKSPPYLSAWD